MRPIECSLIGSKLPILYLKHEKRAKITKPSEVLNFQYFI